MSVSFSNCLHGSGLNYMNDSKAWQTQYFELLI